MITMHDAQKIRAFIRDLEDIEVLKADVPPSFLADQDDEVRAAAWKAACDRADGMLRASLRALGVAA
jgi:hypothetical protein